MANALDTALKWAPLALSVINLGAYLLLWIIGKTLVSKTELGALDKRVVHLEELSGNSPGWGVLNELNQKFGELDGDVKALAEKLEGVGHLLGRAQTMLDIMQQHLLETGK